MPTASAELRSELEASNAQYAEQRSARVELLSQLKAERESIFGNVGAVQDQFDANEEAITQNRAKAQVLENIISALDDTTEAETEASESARLAGIVQKVLQESYTQSADAAGQLASELKLLRETLTENESVQEQLNTFWQAASGQLETYSGSVDLATVSLAQFRNENELLFDGDLTDPLQAEIDQFGTLQRAVENLSEASLSFVADQAIANAEIRLVNPAISDAVESMRDYNAVMGDAQDRLQDVDEISQDVTKAIRGQSTAFDDLRDSTGIAEISLDDVTEALEDVQAASDEISFDEIAREAEALEGTVVPVLDAITQGLADIQDGARIDEAFVDVGLNIGEHLLPGFEIATAFLDTMMQLDELLDGGFVQESAFEGVNAAQGLQLPGESDDAYQRRIQRLRDLGVVDEGDPAQGRTRESTRRTRGGTPVELDRSSARGDRRRRQPSNVTRFDPDLVPFQRGTDIGSEQGVPPTEEQVGESDRRTERLIAIQERYAERLLSIRTKLARDLRDIQTDLARDLRDIDTEATRDRRDIQTDLARDFRDIQTDLARDLAEITTELRRDLRDIDTDLARERRDIQIELVRDIRDIQTDLAREITEINTGLARDLIQRLMLN